MYLSSLILRIHLYLHSVFWLPHIFWTPTYLTSCRMNITLTLPPEIPRSPRHMMRKLWIPALQSLPRMRTFYSDIWRSFKRQTLAFVARSLRRPWQICIGSDLQTHLLIRRRLARYVACAYIDVLCLIAWLRKYRSGFIITIYALDAITQSSLASGLEEMHSII